MVLANVCKVELTDLSRFLLVSLNIKAILQETTVYRRREKLDAITNSSELEDTYDTTIGRVKALIATVQWRTSTMTAEYKSAVEMARR